MAAISFSNIWPTRQFHALSKSNNHASTLVIRDGTKQQILANDAAVGTDTKWGKIMSLTCPTEDKTPLQMKLHKLTQNTAKIGLAVASMVLVILLIKYFTGNMKDYSGAPVINVKYSSNLTPISKSAEEQEFEDTTSSAESNMANNQENNAANNGGNATNNATLRELANPPEMDFGPLCVTLPQAHENFQLKSGFMHILPKFHDYLGDDPHKHLQDFQLACSTVQSQENVDNLEYVKLVAFPFSLQDDAREWLFSLAPGSITIWRIMKQKFIEKYFPASRVASIRKAICGIKQEVGESFDRYRDHFLKLCSKCPQHQIPTLLLIQYFYEDLQPEARSMVDAASGGALMNKTPDEAMTLIANIADNNQQFGEYGSRKVAEIQPVKDPRYDALCEKLDKLFAGIGTVKQVKAYGICTEVGHPTDMCPMLQKENSNNSMPLEPPPQQGMPPPGFQQHGQYRGPQQPPPPVKPRRPLEEIVAELTNNSLAFQQETRAFQQETRAGFNTMGAQITQMGQAISKLEAAVGTGKLPSQVELNPRENVNDIKLRSGKELPDIDKKMVGLAKPIEVPKAATGDMPKRDDMPIPTENELEKSEVKSDHIKPKIVLKPHFPGRLAKDKKDDENQDLLQIFRKVELNIPLLDAIRRIPKYAKFLKELCTKKTKYDDNAKLVVGENVSVIQRKLPEKCKDLGMFSIPCIIGNKKVEKAMLDLGASINVMPLSIFKNLNLGPLKETRVIIQLADRSHVYPVGIVEDVRADHL
ncbi:hypothetical protein C2S51_019437 [Perilla frutescens var. frutescens]|nr:hypothetical protein C2S51_019437 [Perilla frutescens var. frutescens]